LPEFSKTVVAAGLLFFGLSSVFLASRFVRWWKPPGAVLALDRLSRDPTLCGVAFYEVAWWQSGGYTHLHSNVPIVPVVDSAELVKEAPAFNALVAPDGTTAVPASFKRTGCWNGICVYRREGTCEAPQPEDTLNEYLRRVGK
jgi:aryl carrier-like protein